MPKLCAVNESTPDRAVRIVVGLFVLSLMFWGPETWWAALGLIPLVTGLSGRCPLYNLMGLSTCALPAADTGTKKVNAE